jgi:hypothetical protein
MNLTPYRKYRLSTPLPVSEAKQRLWEHLDSKKKWFPTSGASVYDGEIEGGEFTIFEVGPLQAPRSPDIRGQFASTADGKTTIDVCLKLSKPELNIAACAGGFLLICFIGTLWSNWKEVHSLRVTFVFASFLFGSLLLVYLATTINFLLAARRSKKFLARLLEAEELFTP